MKRSTILLFLLAALLTAVAGVFVRVHGPSKMLGDVVVALATLCWLVFLGLLLYKVFKTVEKERS